MLKRVVLTRTVLFIVIYGLVLGVPFYLYSQGYSLLALGLGILLGVFSTLIYSLLRQRYDVKILGEQHKYQSTLLEASKRLSCLRSEEEIIDTIVKIIYAAMSLKNNAGYLKQGDNFKRITLIGDKGNFQGIIPLNHPLVKSISKWGVYRVHDKSKSHDAELVQTAAFFQEHSGQMVIPVTYDERLLAFFILGAKENNIGFSEADIEALNIIAINTALTLENCRFYSDIKRAQAHISQAEKMATIGTMAEGLSHQINNRFHAMGFISGDALETVKIKKTEDRISEEMKTFCDELERALVRIQDNVIQGGEIVQGLMRYTRPGQDGFSAVNIDKTLHAAYEMAQFKMRSYDLKLERHYEASSLPRIKGNATQLQEVFFNLIDNAYDSVLEKKVDFEDESYKPMLSVTIKPQDGFLEICFEDNGMGVKDEDKAKLFTPFFTTKMSTHMGTGIGLYVIHKIIEENHRGRIVFDSEYKKGAKVRIYLPLPAE